jgi:protein-ribulosamine 3-kinase
VPTGGGILTRTVTWEQSWAVQFTHQLNDVITLDNQANGPWAEFDAVCAQVVEAVIPRLLGALQADGREITPALIHGDLWEGNVATDIDTGKVIVFDPGCVYAHNEAEFGGWRCGWATWFRDPVYLELYQREIGMSEPVGEWDDRNRLYAVRAMLCESAGHPGSESRGR